jgi:hypothetical protein
MGNVFIVPVSLLLFNVLNAPGADCDCGGDSRVLSTEVLSTKLIHLRGAIHFSAPLSGPARYSLKDAMENYYPVVYLQEHKKK